MRNHLSRLAGAASLAFVASACSDHSRIASSGAVCGGESYPALTSTSQSILRRTAPLSGNHTSSSMVGPLGGTISVPQAGLTLVIPAGALSTPTRISATANAGPHVVYTFEPHGTQFRLPVSVIQLVSGTRLATNPSLISTLTAGYLANGLSDISSVGAANFAEKFTARLLSDFPAGAAVSFSTTHFSGYAWATGRYQEGDDEMDSEGSQGRCSRSAVE